MCTLTLAHLGGDRWRWDAALPELLSIDNTGVPSLPKVTHECPRWSTPVPSLPANTETSTGPYLTSTNMMVSEALSGQGCHSEEEVLGTALNREGKLRVKHPTPHITV